jgi:ribosome-associated protein YbcJ (S4-like RNA binding protein)
MEGFLESGGIIKFVMEEKKVRFEINVTAAKRAKLKIRSQLLRLAKRVVEEKPSHEAKN